MLIVTLQLPSSSPPKAQSPELHQFKQLQENEIMAISQGGFSSREEALEAAKAIIDVMTDDDNAEVKPVTSTELEVTLNTTTGQIIEVRGK